MDRAELLGKKPLAPLILQFSIPAIAGMLIMALNSVIGGIFVGRGVTPLAISGIAISMPLIFIMMAFSMLSGLGATTLVSLRLGQGNKEEAEKILGNAITLTFFLSVIVTIIGILFLNPILKLFGAQGEALNYAKPYMHIIFAGTVFQTISFTLNSIIRGEGNPVMAFSTMVVGFIAYVLLSYIGIFILHWGIRAVAGAVVLSQVMTSIWTLLYFTTKRSHLHLHFRNLILDEKIIEMIVKIGFAPFGMQISSCVFLIVFNRMLGLYGGNEAIAAMGIGFSLYNLILMPIVGINQGIQPIIGFNYGAKNFLRVKKTLLISVLVASGACLLGFFAIQLFIHPIMSVFVKNDTRIIEVGSHGLKIFMLALPVIGFQIIGTGYFQAAGKPKHALFLGLSRQLIFLVPLLFILPHFFKLAGVWSSGPIADILAATITCLFLITELRRIDKKHIDSLTPSKTAG